MKEYIQAEPADRLEVIPMSVRTFNCLMRHGVQTVGDFMNLTREEILKVRNFGLKNQEEIKSLREKMGAPLE